ncbi:MAG: hypothetical protein ACREE6_17080, partial [Limisphaerales bacterium]
RIDSTVQWVFPDGPEYPTNDTAYNLTFDIPVTNLVNGLYAMNDYVAPLDEFGQVSYDWYVQAIDANGSPGQDVLVDQGYTPPPVGGTTNNWATPPFYDGRAQLKQNLIFLLREPCGDQPFAYDVANSAGGPEGDYTQAPTNYAYAGFYNTASIWNGYEMTPTDHSLDVFRPFEENYLYANFIFSATDYDENGVLTTRINCSVSDIYPTGMLLLTNAPSSLFQQPTTGEITIPTQLDEATFLYCCAFNGQGEDYVGIAYTNGIYYYVAGLGFTFTQNPDSSQNFAMNGETQNYFGIQIDSASTFYYSFSDSGFEDPTEYPGGTMPDIGMMGIFPNVAQPDFQTVDYDFWNPALDSLPGDGNFSPTNGSRQFMIMSAGDTINVAGYAKMAVQNAYPGVYGYLGQYFDQAYQIDTNGNVTTNSAGVLSPYGQFFDMQPGAVALVTMPDVDTGQRGTDIVYALKLQLDVNHDGTMDLRRF